jgi:hypothetical protein
MVVGLNCGCPTRMRMVYDLLCQLGYSTQFVTLYPAGKEGSAALRIDTDKMAILGKNPRYPGTDGDGHGCEVIIDLCKRQ